MASRSAAVFALFFLICVPFASAATAAGAEATGLKLRLALAGIEPGLSGVWMAKEKGFFEEEHLEVELVNFAGGSEGIFALASGDLPVTVVGGPAAARGMVAGLDIRFVAELVDHLPYSLSVSSRINSPADLAGKRFAIGSVGGLTDFAARLILGKLKVETDQVSFLAAGEERNRLAALQAGSVDGTVLLPPCSTIARRLGFRAFADGNSEGIGGAQDYLVVSARALAERRDGLLRLLRAIIKGNRYFKAHPEEGRACLVKYLQIEDPEGLAETCEAMAKLLSANGHVNPEGIQHLLDFIDDERSRRLRPENLIDTYLVDELEKNGEIERTGGQGRQF